MDTRDRNFEGIVLKSASYKEQDRLLTLISAEGGIEKAIARGGAKAGGSLRAVSQPYARVSLLLSPPKGGLSFVSEGQPLETFLRLDAGLERFAYGAYVAELAISASPEGKAAPMLYQLLLAVYELLKLDDDLPRTARFYELQLLSVLGVLPSLECCADCGQVPYGRGFVLSPDDGALLCESCAAGTPWPRLSSGAVLSARRMLEIPLSKLPSLQLSRGIQQELGDALAVYLDRHLERSSKARRFLWEMLGNDKDRSS